MSNKPYFTEEQFNNFTGESSYLSSLAEYFRKFITNKQVQAKQQELGDTTQSLQNKESASSFGKKGESQNPEEEKSEERPHISSLSLEDHKSVIEEYEHTVLGHQLDPRQTQAIQVLKPKILAEQQAYQHFVYHCAKESSEHYNYVYPEAEQLLKVDSQTTKRIQSYPQYFVLQKTVGINVGAWYPSDPVLEFTQHLSQMGSPPLVHLPTETKKLDLSCDSRFINSEETDSLQLSEDPLVARLVQEHQVDICLTSQALQTLINNQPPSYMQTWGVPVVVKDIKGKTENHSSTKVICIEKPLPKKEVSPPELNTKLYKSCVRKLLLQSHDNNEECSESSENSLNEKSVSGSNSSSKKSFAYSLWKLGKLTLLIRAKIDGHCKHSDEENGYVSLVVKPEYLTSYGLERLSPSETARFWTKAFIRPGTSLLCTRVDMPNNEIIRVDELKPADVLASGTVFSPNLGMKLLFNFFSALTQLFQGCYFFSHESKALHCCLYKNVTSKIVLSSRKPEVDLFARYAEDVTVRKFQVSEIPWNGIDVNIFTGEQIEEKVLPGMFSPLSTEALRKLEEKRRMEEEHFRKLQNPNRTGDPRKQGKKKKKKKNWKKRALPFDETQLTLRQKTRVERAAKRYKDFDCMES